MVPPTPAVVGETTTEVMTGQLLMVVPTDTLPVLAAARHCRPTVTEVVAPAVIEKVADPAQVVPPSTEVALSATV